jgi:hypothetical protein
MGQGKHFQHSPSKNMLFFSHAENWKVATLRNIANIVTHQTQALSSAKRRTVKPNGGFHQAHEGGATTALLR